MPPKKSKKEKKEEELKERASKYEEELKRKAILRQQVIEAYNNEKKDEKHSSNILKQDEETDELYQSDVEVEDEGIGRCSECKKKTYTLKLNTHQVLCINCIEEKYRCLMFNPEMAPFKEKK